MSEPSPLNDDQVRQLAAAIWAARPSDPLAESDPVRVADRTVADVLSRRNLCPHGVQNGHVLRPTHGTPGCPFCRSAYLAAYRAAQG